MSRIAGLVPAPDRTAVDRMLEAMVGQVATTRDVRTAGRAALGVLTWRASNVAAADEAVVAIDSPMWHAADVLALYRKHGFVDALAHIDGDFAISLFDAKTNTLWLARDRFGIKPLYYGGATAPLRIRFAPARAARVARDEPRAEQSVRRTVCRAALPHVRQRATRVTVRGHRAAARRVLPRSPRWSRRARVLVLVVDPAAGSRRERSRAGRALSRLADRCGRTASQDREQAGVHALGWHGFVVGARVLGSNDRSQGARVLDRLSRRDLRRDQGHPDHPRCHRRRMASSPDRQPRSRDADPEDDRGERRTDRDGDVAVALRAVRSDPARGFRHVVRRPRWRRAQRRRVRVLLLLLRRSCGGWRDLAARPRDGEVGRIPRPSNLQKSHLP